MSGPLTGVRVLEFTTVVLGPLACQTLGDMGADVVKVEPPHGDSNRYIGPARHSLMGALFLTCNRNKRSIVLDLKMARGREAALRLAARADVLVHNFRPAALERIGLDYATVRNVNPGVVYCGTYGFSRRGPYRDLPAYDDSIQAASGLATLVAGLGGEPRYLPTLVGDKTTAMAVVGAVTAALYHRERTGAGQEVEVPMFETLVSYVMAEHLFGHVFEPPEGQLGYTRLLTEHRRPYPTRDGYVAVLPYLDDHWRKFCHAAGRPDLTADARYATLAARAANIAEVYEEIGRIVVGRTTAEWLAALAGTGVPVMAVHRLADLIDDEHLVATGFWREFDHPTEGRLRLPAPPVTFGATPAEIRSGPPRLGEHTEEILQEAGFTSREIAELRASGATRART